MTAILRGPWLIVQALKNGGTHLLAVVPKALDAEQAMEKWKALGDSAPEKWPAARAILAITPKKPRRRPRDDEDEDAGE